MSRRLNSGQNTLRNHLDTRLDALEGILLSDAMRQRRPAEAPIRDYGSRDYGLPHAASPVTSTSMREEDEPARWPPAQPELHSTQAASKRAGGTASSSGSHPVRERDVVLLERLGFEAAEAEHALSVAESNPADATTSRIECAVRWLCQHPQDNITQSEGRTKVGSPAHTAVRGSLEHVERLQRAAGGQGPDPADRQGTWPCGEVPLQHEGYDGHQYLSPLPQRRGGAPSPHGAAASTPAVASPLLGEERERRRLLTVLSHAPSAEILAALQSHLLRGGPASSAAVSMLSALLPAEQFPAHWMQVVAGE